MSNGCVSINDFKKLEQKVNRLLVIHELDAVLTEEEKKLVTEAKGDLASGKKEQFASIDKI